MQGFGNPSNYPNANVYFDPIANHVYRIVNVKETNKAFTVTKGHQNQKLFISDYVGDDSQKFTFVSKNNRIAFVAKATNTALYIPHHNKNNGAEVEADGGQHKSNWFEIARAKDGQWANKGYAIKTLCGKSLDIESGNTSNGTRILQWDSHNDWNQVWLIVPADQPIILNNQNLNQSQNQWGNQSQNQWGNQPQQTGHGHNGEHGHHGGKGHHGSHGNHGNGHNEKTGNSNQGFQVETVGFFKKNYTYALYSAGNQSKCLEVTNDGHVIIADFHGAVNQKFLFEFDPQTGQKNYLIKSSVNGQYLNGPGFGGGDIVTKDKGHVSEAWSIDLSKKVAGSYTIRSFTGHAIDVPGGNFSNGTRVQKHGFHGDTNQSWFIVEK
jgi:hypothetical protein